MVLAGLEGLEVFALHLGPLLPESASREGVGGQSLIDIVPGFRRGLGTVAERQDRSQVQRKVEVSRGPSQVLGHSPQHSHTALG